MAEEHAIKHPEVHLHVERVQYRSAAWRELWRRIFVAIGEELGIEGTGDCTGLGTSEPGGNPREPRT